MVKRLGASYVLFIWCAYAHNPAPILDEDRPHLQGHGKTGEGSNTEQYQAFCWSTTSTGDGLSTGMGTTLGPCDLNSEDSLGPEAEQDYNATARGKQPQPTLGWRHLEEEGDVAMLMDTDGAQQGLLDEHDIDELAEGLVAQIRELRQRDGRMARDLVWIMGCVLRRGLRSRMPSLRQVSRRLCAIQNTWAASLNHYMNVHSNHHASWASRFWTKVRRTCRMASRRHGKKEVEGQRQEAMVQADGPDGDNRQGEDLQGEKTSSSSSSLQGQAAGPSGEEVCPDRPATDHRPNVEDEMSTLGGSSAARARWQEDLQQGRDAQMMANGPEIKPAWLPEMDVAEQPDHTSLMAYATHLPPWRRKANPRDRWLVPSGGGWEHRRRYKEDKKRWREPSPPQQPKSKGKGRKGKTQKTSETRRLTPFNAWNSKRRPQASCHAPAPEEELEVVAVEDDSREVEQPSAGNSAQQPQQEELSLTDALALWRDILDYEHEPNTLGYPQYVRDRVANTSGEWTGPEVTTMLVAHQQLQSLESAQIAEILQARIEELRGEEGGEDEGEDESAMMQSSAKVHHRDEGISTYGLDLQFLTDELGALPKVRAQVRAELRRGLLSKRYGNHAGRCSMGQRAAALEAAVSAYGADTGELDGVENQEDKEWGQRWWLRLLKAIVSEETSRSRTSTVHNHSLALRRRGATVHGIPYHPIIPRLSHLTSFHLLHDFPVVVVLLLLAPQVLLMQGQLIVPFLSFEVLLLLLQFLP